MENSRGFFGRLWHLALLILKYLLILGVILVCLLLYFTHKQKTAGQDWCEEMIASYEGDKAKFIEEHSQNTVDGLVYFPTGSIAKYTMANFTIDTNGDYECAYTVGGLTKPHGNKYDSKTGGWISY